MVDFKDFLNAVLTKIPWALNNQLLYAACMQGSDDKYRIIIWLQSNNLLSKDGQSFSQSLSALLVCTSTLTRKLKS